MESEYNLLENDSKEAEDNAMENDDDDDEEEEEQNSVKASGTGRLAKTSMTESYSEILNSPLFDNNEAITEQQIDIPKRRPTSLSRKQSSQGLCSPVFETVKH